ncbi:uncharacterized protein [Palaemon carinicauda]|uniref:uncharacterized protein n=1 Tax=Palaemon carinicauda TaxID=392227 RepID=UPI0035B62B69
MVRDCKACTRCTKCNGAHCTLMCGVRLEMNLKKEESESKEGVAGIDKPGDVALLTGQGADNYHHDSPIEIDILIGLDFSQTPISPVDAFQINHVVVMKSLFGYVLSGRLYKTNDSCTYSVPQLLCISSVSDSDLCKFWDVETVGVRPGELVESYSETKVFKEFESTLKFVNGRYEIALPWKDDSDKEKLLNNVVIAHKRLGRLMVKLEHDEELKKEYQKVFDSYESDHMMEEAHHSTPDLVEVLIRFCHWPIAVTADIRKAFLQISVQEKDRDVHRFLWPRGDGTLRHMRFTHVPFGQVIDDFAVQKEQSKPNRSTGQVIYNTSNF